MSTTLADDLRAAPCIACANGNDLSDGDECMACGRIGGEPVTRPAPPDPPESPLGKAIRIARGGPAPTPKRGFA